MSMQGAMAQQCPAGLPMTYPVSKTVDQVDDYHGIKVADPYRWLEDSNSAATHDWIAAQNQLTQSYLSEIPARSAIRERLTTLWNYERYSVPFRESGRYFISRNDGLQSQAVLYTMAELDDVPRLLLDPNTLAADGTVALAGMAVSPDGRYLAYGTAASGSDWNTWKIRDIDSGKDLADELAWVKFSGASWSKDGKGFFYSRYDAPSEATKLAEANYFQKLYYHQIGTLQSADVLVYDRPDHKDWGFDGRVTDDGKYLIITIWQGTERKSRVYYKDLAVAGNPVLPLLDAFDAAYSFIDNNGPVFLFRTDKEAPRSRIVAIDVRKPGMADWKELVPQAAETLLSANLVGERIIGSYLQDAHSQIKVFDLNGTFQHDVALPGLGTASGFGGKRDEATTYYSYTGFTTPTTIYRYDIASDTSSVIRQPKVAFDPTDYETRQVFYRSKDGTRVPMFIVNRKGIKLDGSNPTYLYGYGGFNISLTPAFSVANLAWMEMGGVYAVPNLRGGGEYGESWHQAGTKLQKQNVFDDFIGAAEWLIANKVTSTPKLAIGGGSNGGLLVGAALTQRPELFGAALPAVGVMDMLRFHKFTIGWAWTADYGSSDDAAQFAALRAYSPLHNLRSGTCYPATLVTTADHDDRVVPAHSFKFAAAEQAAQAGPAPVLIRIDTKAGHGAGKPTGKQIDEVADRWGFLTRVLGMDSRKP
ncbi:prolyl oligopeptidase family serine peptidase [Actimicrobium sp. CCI2.3]|uniref:prolyl oligopeptidase family serine peptidase n=1 Tax=Actimicrobium sp. CCI2.3 TaxID=3048616 RepID=UPI002AB4C858|nr:prolyl oligopeptidase family serine peptidase [Actimicrobium sp. CCI2.3]MDY7575916.1 prolyl oligopeptidase family serine peptidase [Actimicrobium sp. CCI2.3]MEB0023184.1 prolyl oligopeptidase family serine peptidase [Actimicrobium sp. CCI2.3]